MAYIETNTIPTTIDQKQIHEGLQQMYRKKYKGRYKINFFMTFTKEDITLQQMYHKKYKGRYKSF